MQVINTRCFGRFWPVSWTPIWGPRAIFMVAEAQGVLRCRSSTLAILADSGPFHGILLIDLGFWSDFMVTEP